MASRHHIVNENCVSVSAKLEDGNLKGLLLSLDQLLLHLHALHLHRLAAELLGELGQLGAALVEPSQTVAANPLCGLLGVHVVRVDGWVEHLADATGGELLLLAVPAVTSSILALTPCRLRWVFCAILVRS